MLKGLFAVCLLLVMASGCAEYSEESHVTPAPAPSYSYTKENRSVMEKISDELDMLKSKGWDNLASQLGRPKTAALLWYHLRASYAVDAKVVFGNPNKLDAAVAIQTGSDSTSLPRVSVKGADYYIIDPSIPEIVTEFKYGDMFDDPGGGSNYFANHFRLNKEDIERIKQWTMEAGASIEYTDFPGR